LKKYLFFIDTQQVDNQSFIMEGETHVHWPDITHPADAHAFQSLGLKKLLYIGPWFHLEPTIHAEFRNIKEFIYVDTQPLGENETKPYDTNSYKTNFVEDLMTKCACFGYELISDYIIDPEHVYTVLNRSQRKKWCVEYPHINPHMFKFENKYTKQILKYYISTNFLYTMNKELRTDMCDADGLILSGYFPHKALLHYFPQPKTIIGFTETVYPVGELYHYLEQDNIMPSLINDTNTDAPYWANNYFLMSIHTNHIVKCENITEMGELSVYEIDQRYGNESDT
jgi:hypothetical protein